MSFKKEIEKRKKIIDSALNNILYEYKNKGIDKLSDAIKYSVLNGGKRIRPILTLMTYESFGNKIDEDIINLACGIEFLHSASLILDDLPCMDNSEYRRGKKATHSVYGESTTVLASAALLTLTFELFSKISSPNLNEIIRNTTNSIGIRGMILGQFEDIESFNKENSLKKLNKDYYLKTGILFCNAVKIAGLLANANEEELKALENYGKAFGKAYQIRDDILDIEGNEKEIGKSISLDSKNGKLTPPLLIGIDKSKKIIDDEIDKAKQAIKVLNNKSDLLEKSLSILRN